MIPTVLGIGAITLGVSLAGLLVFGTRWSRAGLARSVGYAVAVVTPAYEIGSRIWRLPTGNLLTACTFFLVVILAFSSLERDWNPPSQAFFGVLATNCVAFTIFTVIFALSGQLAGPAIPAALFVSALEIFAFVLLLIGTHEALDVAGRIRWHRRNPGPLGPNVSAVRLDPRSDP
jgi:hypothetical protein